MTRRTDPSIDDLESRIEDLRSKVGSSDHDWTLTEKEREELESLFRDVEDLSPDERERYEEIQATLPEENGGDSGVSGGSLTSAEKQLLAFMLEGAVYDDTADATEVGL